LQRSEVIEKVNKVLVDGFELSIQKLKPEAHLYHDLGIDSLDAVDMIVFLEEQSGIQVKGEWFRNVRHLDDIYNVMESVLNGRVPNIVSAGADVAPIAGDVPTSTVVEV